MNPEPHLGNWEDVSVTAPWLWSRWSEHITASGCTYLKERIHTSNFGQVYL